ncbi:hypothetical protein A4A58_18510 [Tardiphaga robiniae]|uniref:Uncharacterized protein n=1 Tax=Tardiphaga robiniae TaxID=943830 RepID=A0A163XCG7_9BRAD|nr:hypothetical protein A4A58_18510 [Tardiphaga robiniae]
MPIDFLDQIFHKKIDDLTEVSLIGPLFDHEARVSCESFKFFSQLTIISSYTFCDLDVHLVSIVDRDSGYISEFKLKHRFVLIDAIDHFTIQINDDRLLLSVHDRPLEHFAVVRTFGF